MQLTFPLDSDVSPSYSVQTTNSSMHTFHSESQLSKYKGMLLGLNSIYGEEVRD